MTTLNAKANAAYHALVAETERENPGDVWAGFENERDAFEAGYEAAASQLVAAHPVEPAPVASRERVAEALHDNDHAHSWRDERFCPNYACLYVYLPMADALLAAGVFRESPTRDQIISALASAEGRSVEGKSDEWLQMAEETFGFRADAVLALLNGNES